MKENQLKIQIDQDQKILDLCKSKINDLRQKIKTYRQIIEENSKIKEKKTEDFQGEERKERIRYHKEGRILLKHKCYGYEEKIAKNDQTKTLFYYFK